MFSKEEFYLSDSIYKAILNMPENYDMDYELDTKNYIDKIYATLPNGKQFEINIKEIK